MLLLAALIVAGAVAVGVIALSSDSTSQTRAIAPTSQSGGPNETSRGNAAASATGSSQPSQSGGPNEALRGNAAASASRP
jgi:hypothetical protein